MNQTLHSIQVFLKNNITDVAGRQIETLVKKYLGIDTGKIKSGKIFLINYPLTVDQLVYFAEHGIRDPVINDIWINGFVLANGFQSYIIVAKLPGVTDDEGISAQKTLFDILNISFDLSTQHIFSQEIILFEHALSKEQLKDIAENFLGNKLIHHFQYGNYSGSIEYYLPEVKIVFSKEVELIDMNISDYGLLKLSDEKLFSLNLEEMVAIQSYYRREDIQAFRRRNEVSSIPTDCELEIIAQTWSEHCKHKEFNAVIEFENKENGNKKKIDSLFKTYITSATEQVKSQLEANGNHWLIKVFSDNAGVVRVNDNALLAWKVETHNSPSAIDPYGGAITGILGNNRDPMGTGIGGAKLLFNTNVLCFGSPSYSKPLLTGQLHPRRIFEGVRKGIEDGGNKSGIPTVNGAIIFDDRYAGKPLVYCGTGGIMPFKYGDKNTWNKEINDGDLIVSVGGRVGKDGIHGATFSSRELDESSPQSAVQIGSPITQKLVSDFLEIACKESLVKCSTDCGAGGLSSAVGELAGISNGAVVHLEKVPLKYNGLKPWEIFLSESQERMILVVEKEKVKELLEFADLMEVEATVIGKFTCNGYLKVCFEDQIVALLQLEFLHDGVPKKYLMAEWKNPQYPDSPINVQLDYNDILKSLMGSINICSRESVIRQYDHEVKGKTIIKPLMGELRQAPQDAAVMRIDFLSYEGIAISNGIVPKLADIDPYNMSACAFDEAIRQIISVGGRLPNITLADNIFWSVNDNFCVPDSVFHPVNNPDGKQKLGQLVLMCEALYDMSVFYSIPMTSGKDSMKNDFKGDGVKISVPPTILYSITAKIPDVRNTVTSDFKQSGDLIYHVGHPYEELGGSEFYLMINKRSSISPKVRKEEGKSVYLKMMKAHELQLLRSSHDISDGGLITAIVESCFGTGRGINLELNETGNISLHAFLFSESPSRFIVSVAPEKQSEFELIMKGSIQLLGKVSKDSSLIVNHLGTNIISLKVSDLLQIWKNGLLN
jgi:phosphoribosylformylglycinamidine synthase